MKVVILDGTYGTTGNQARDQVMAAYKDHDLDYIKLEDKKIAYCTGCWSCWVKTPGACCHGDDTQEVLRASINADFVVILTENAAGYMTSLSKKMLEKFVPLVHPYIELVDGECHHIARYDKYPKLGLVYLDEDLDHTDFHITRHMVKRAALNFKTSLDYAVHSAPGKELAIEDIRI